MTTSAEIYDAGYALMLYDPSTTMRTVQFRDARHRIPVSVFNDAARRDLFANDQGCPLTVVPIGAINVH